MVPSHRPGDAAYPSIIHNRPPVGGACSCTCGRGQTVPAGAATSWCQSEPGREGVEYLLPRRSGPVHRAWGPRHFPAEGGKKTESGASVVLASTINTRPPGINSSVWHSPTFKSLAPPPPVPGRGRIRAPEPPPNTHGVDASAPKGRDRARHTCSRPVQRRVPDWNLVGTRTKKGARFKPPGQDPDV